jgi:hypothetical protein
LSGDAVGDALVAGAWLLSVEVVVPDEPLVVSDDWVGVLADEPPSDWVADVAESPAVLSALVVPEPSAVDAVPASVDSTGALDALEVSDVALESPLVVFVSAVTDPPDPVCDDPGEEVVTFEL